MGERILDERLETSYSTRAQRQLRLRKDDAFYSPSHGIDEFQSIMRKLYLDWFPTPGGANRVSGRAPPPEDHKGYGATTAKILDTLNTTEPTPTAFYIQIVSATLLQHTQRCRVQYPEG